MVRNDNIPDEKKFLEIDLSIKKAPDNYKANNVDKKKEQLSNRLCLVSYIVAFIELHRQGYRIIKYVTLLLLFKVIKSLYFLYSIVNFTALNLQGITSLHLLTSRVRLLLLKLVRLSLQTTGVA